METLRLLDEIDKFDVPSVEDVVDSMSPPYAAEYVSAQHALAQDCATLQRIDQDMEECLQRIANAQAQMRFLRRERSVVQRRMSIHRARLSPVRSVPDQVLQEIFQHCIPDDPYIVPSTRSAPLVLTHVCRRWRIVAQGTSELWASIALHDHGVWNYELEIQMVKQWLDRSRMRPIRMSITCTPRIDFGLDRDTSSSGIFQLAIAHSGHLGDLHLNVDRGYWVRFMEHASLPMLHSVAIALQSDHRIDEPPEPDAPVFISTPNLKQISFKGSWPSAGVFPRTLFPHITHLTLDCTTVLDLALLFRDFPNLEHLTLALSHGLDVRLPPTSDPKIVVPSLVRLEVCLDADVVKFGDPEVLGMALDNLELPSLQVLTIGAPPRYDEGAGRLEMAWARCPGVASLLSRSRYARPRCEYREWVCSRWGGTWA